MIFNIVKKQWLHVYKRIRWSYMIFNIVKKTMSTWNLWLYYKHDMRRIKFYLNINNLRNYYNLFSIKYIVYLSYDTESFLGIPLSSFCVLYN